MDLRQKTDRDRPIEHRPGAGGVGLLAAGGLLLAAVVVADLALSDRSLGAEWPPATGVGYLVRSSLLALASIALVIGARRTVTGALHTTTVEGSPRPIAVGAIGLGMVPAAVSAALLVTAPDTLSELVREDGPVEWASAVLAFGAGGLYGAAAVAHLRRPGPTSMMTVLALVAAAGAAVLLGLEEISWFQRVLDVESPEFMLNRNGQQELNLHNLATGLTGNLYFVGGFLFCCALPFLLADRALPGPLAPLQPLVPGRIVLLATATSSAIVYEMWNIIWIQLTFWMTLVMLATVDHDHDHDHTTRRLARVVLGVSVVVWGIYLVAGDTMVRSWDDTEVREVVIPYGLALAGYGTLVRVRRDQPSG